MIVKEMKQIVYIHGGMIFQNQDKYLEILSKRDYNPKSENRRKWKQWLTEQLTGQFEVLKPEMPNKDNASYKLWKLRFEKVLAYLNDEDTILIGHSLGAQFLIKYIGESGFPKKITQIHLVASAFDESDMDEDEKYSGDFEYSPEIINTLEKYVDQIFIYHSTDDDIVPYSHAEKIKSYLPKAKLLTFIDRKHFNQPEFPELLENIVR